eukprot:scaffold205203_cov22-Tisochrysis_lutea.AAC.1
MRFASVVQLSSNYPIVGFQIQLRCASSTSESSRTEALSAAFVQELPMQPDSMPLAETVQVSVQWCLHACCSSALAAGAS